MALCVFNAASQLGDFIALISSQIIVKVIKPKATVATSMVVFSIAASVVVMVVLNFIFLHPRRQGAQEEERDNSFNPHQNDDIVVEHKEGDFPVEEEQEQ